MCGFHVVEHVVPGGGKQARRRAHAPGIASIGRMYVSGVGVSGVGGVTGSLVGHGAKPISMISIYGINTRI